MRPSWRRDRPPKDEPQEYPRAVVWAPGVPSAWRSHSRSGSRSIPVHSMCSGLSCRPGPDRRVPDSAVRVRKVGGRSRACEQGVRGQEECITRVQPDSARGAGPPVCAWLSVGAVDSGQEGKVDVGLRQRGRNGTRMPPGVPGSVMGDLQKLCRS